MPVKPVNSDNFEKEVLEFDKPVVVDFYADWCGPCKMAGPILDRLADEFKGKIKVVKIDIDESQQLAQKYQVMSIPTVVVFNKGKEKERKVGFPGEEGYRTMISGLAK